MDANDYFQITQKKPHKSKVKNKSLPQASEKYLEAFEKFKRILEHFEIKDEEYFHFKSTKHWRFDFHLIGYQYLIEIASGPWSGGRKGRLATKAWSLDRYDHAEEMGYGYMRFEVSDVNMGRAMAWLRQLKASHGTDQTISPNRPN